MTNLMIDLETLGTGPDACILTIAAQSFDPFESGHHARHYYARIDIDCQTDRSIDQGTVDWWAKQPAAAQQEAFAEDDRIYLPDALAALSKLIWNSTYIWAVGPTFDMVILEHAYKSYNMSLPWQYHKVRDARTVYSLHPELNKPPVSHHALEDCRRQILLLQETLRYLGVKDLR